MNGKNVQGELLKAVASSEAAAVAEIVEKYVEPRLMNVTDGIKTVQVFVAPEGIDITSVKALVDEYRDGPERRKGTVELTELKSFVAFVKRFLDEDSALFADRDATAPALLAVLNYHCMTADGRPRFGDHRARYAFPLSDEWKAWTAGSGKKMSQADFAAFLEDRIIDVADPLMALESTKAQMEALQCAFASPARLIDLSRGLTIRVSSNVVSQQNLANGVCMMRFETSHQDERGAPLEVPGAFVIKIPVFRGNDAAYQLAARLRYRVNEQKLVFWYELFRTTETFDHAFNEACDFASVQTELPLFMGKPEPI